MMPLFPTITTTATAAAAPAAVISGAGEQPASQRNRKRGACFLSFLSLFMHSFSLKLFNEPYTKSRMSSTELSSIAIGPSSTRGSIRDHESRGTRYPDVIFRHQASDTKSTRSEKMWNSNDIHPVTPLRIDVRGEDEQCLAQDGIHRERLNHCFELDECCKNFRCHHS